jgi:hypothetical protein
LGDRRTEEPGPRSDLEDPGIRRQSHRGDGLSRRLHQSPEGADQGVRSRSGKHLPPAQPKVTTVALPCHLWIMPSCHGDVSHAVVITKATILIYQQRSGWQSQETRAAPSVAA